ncbi:MAG: T9SS type A sorting domain-containing protein [Chitinophagales bacterium]|nr:T9SS type A sorting domain-containing protein [Chitinophagales bacterium]
MKHILPVFLFFLFNQASAQLHNFVVTTRKGGDFNKGAFFVADSNGNNFHKVYSFKTADGSEPEGDLVFDQNGIVYGVTLFGGAGDSCVIYSFDLNTNTYTLEHDFYDTKDSGWWDHSGGILLPDGKLYGVGQAGGLYGGGSIYRFDPVTDLFESLFDFDSASGLDSESGLVDMGNGKLYGTTPGGGLHNQGTLYSFDPLTKDFRVLHNFIDSTGAWVGSGKLTKGKDGNIYGVAKGSMFSTKLFRYNLTTNNYTVVHDFVNLFDGADIPNCLVHTANGKLYGAAGVGGPAPYDGYLFSYDIQTDSVTVLKSFTDSTGLKPRGGLTLASNGKLYGTLSEGGIYGGGSVFSFDIATGTFASVYQFDSISGARPVGSVTEVVTGISTGIVNTTELKFKIMPNPASSSVLVNSPLAIDKIFLSDLNGKVCSVTTKQITPGVFVLGGLDSYANGTYFITVICGKQQKTSKLVIQK